MDCVHLLISGKDTQWRLLLEQRSTGYVWGSGECEGLGREVRGVVVDQDDQGVMQRSRLQGLKQMSVDKIANIRQRLAEGRRMLRTRYTVHTILPIQCLQLEFWTKYVKNQTKIGPNIEENQS